MSQRVWKVAGALCVAAAVAVAAPVASWAANAAPSPATPKCLEVFDGPTDGDALDLQRGAPANQWTCDPGARNQEWTAVLVGEGGPFGTGIYQFRNTLTNMCLEVYNGRTGRGIQDMRNGARVDEWTCFTGHFNQEWSYREVATAGRYGQPVLELVNRQSGKCAEVYDGPTGQGTQDLGQGAEVDQWTCVPGHANQEWEPLLSPIAGDLDFEFLNENG